MSVNLILQSDDGTVAGANAYDSVDGFKAYCDNRRRVYSSFTDDTIAACLILGTDYIDIRWEFPGAKLTGSSQSTEWPRQDVPDIDTVPQDTTNYAYWLDSVWPLVYPGATIMGLDPALKKACDEYAWIALFNNVDLLVNQFANPASKGGGIIDTTTTKVGPIETTRKFRPLYNGAAVWPAYPIADRFLQARGLVLNRTGRRVTR